MRVLVLVLLSLFAAPAVAQEPTSREVLGRVLTLARESKALERILGVRHLRWDDRGSTALITLEGTLLDDGQAVRLALSINGADGRMHGHGLALAFTYGFDGALRRFELAERKGGKAGEGVEGRVEDGALVISGDGRERRSDWSDQAMPIEVALFFLVSLADQGLPEQLVVRPFEGDDGHLERVTTTLETRRDGDGWTLAIRAAPPFTDASSARADASGTLVEVTFGRKRCAPVDATEVERLKKLIAEAPAPRAPR